LDEVVHRKLGNGLERNYRIARINAFAAADQKKLQ